MNIAIILISGLGSRLDNDIPKQYINIKQQPLYSYCLKTFLNHKMINQIILVAKPEWFDFINNYLNEQKIKGVVLVQGGNSRNQSLKNAFEFIKQNIKDIKPNDVILTHDGVRPLVSEQIITNNINQAKVSNSIINTAIKCTDSICKSTNGLNVTEQLDRNFIYLSQTPQTSNYEIFKKVYSNNYENELFLNTDYCTLAKANNIDVKITFGSKLNFKITTIDDLELFKKII